MSQTIHVPKNATKEQKYEAIVSAFEHGYLSSTANLIANLDTVASVLHAKFHFHWVGFYLTTRENVLTLGPSRGAEGACTEILFTNGICGAAARTKKTQLVPDVHARSEHIACSSSTKSEIVVPLAYNGQIHIVLDVDSRRLKGFSKTDQKWLEKLVALIAKRHFECGPADPAFAPNQRVLYKPEP